MRKSSLPRKGGGIFLFLILTIYIFQPIIFLFAEEAAVLPQNYFSEGMRLRDQGEFAEAERMFKKAIEQDPGNADYHFELANLYAAIHDRSLTAPSGRSAEMLERAARELDQTLMLRPDDLAARFNLGVIDKRLGRYEAAREQFKKVLALNPQAVNAQMQIGSTYEEQGFFDEAEDAYRKAREMDYRNPDIQYALEDLETRRQQAHQRSEHESMAAAMARSPLSSSGGLYGNGQQQYGQDGQQQSGGNMLPYLGAMLIQQMMSKKSSNNQQT